MQGDAALLLPKRESVLRWAETAIAELTAQYNAIPGKAGTDEDNDVRRARLLCALSDIYDGRQDIERASDRLVRILLNTERAGHIEDLQGRPQQQTWNTEHKDG